jgi:phage gp45-like
MCPRSEIVVAKLGSECVRGVVVVAKLEDWRVQGM